MMYVLQERHIPALCEHLAMMVSTGTVKEEIGIELSHEQVKHLTDTG